MRYGLAFYELDGPLFALESGRRHMSLYVAEQDVVIKHKEALPGVNTARSVVRFSDLNRLPLDVVEKIVRDSVAARRVRATQGSLPTQAELLKLWAIKEEAVQVPVLPAKTAVKTASTNAKAAPAKEATSKEPGPRSSEKSAENPKGDASAGAKTPKRALKASAAPRRDAAQEPNKTAVVGRTVSKASGAKLPPKASGASGAAARKAAA
jgi:hypothetical protein